MAAVGSVVTISDTVITDVMLAIPMPCWSTTRDEGTLIPPDLCKLDVAGLTTNCVLAGKMSSEMLWGKSRDARIK